MNIKRILVALALLGYMINCLFAEEKKMDSESFVKNYKLEQRSHFKEIDSQVAKAKKLVAQGKFEEASELCQKAIKELKKGDGQLAKSKLRRLEKTQRSINAAWSSYFMTQARRLCLDGKYEKAIGLATSASERDIRKADDVYEFIKYCRKCIKAEEYKTKTTIDKFEKDYSSNKEKTSILYREALILYKNKRYNDVRKKLEKLFIIDPYHRKATRLLGRTYQKMYAIAARRRDTDMEGYFAYSEWVIDEAMPAGAGTETTNITQIKGSSNNDLYEKMRNIIFPQIDFKDTNINSVVKYLNAASKRYDPEKQGVTIIGVNPRVADKLRRVTISFDHMPLNEIIRYLTQQLGLKYKIEGNYVIIGTSDIVDDMVRKTFKVRASMISEIARGTGGAGAGGDGAGATKEKRDISSEDALGATDFDDFKTTEKAEVNATAEALIKYFEDRGISFDQEAGASIAYNRLAQVLEVKNTADNLRKLEDLLRQLDVDIPLVLVEAKIIEINQTDLEELGFDWYLNSNANADGARWSITKNDTLLRHFYTVDEPNTTDSSSGGASKQPYKLLDNLSIFPNFGDTLFGKDTPIDLSLTVNAINQNEKGEVLSAPKVITKSGTTATIRMIKQEYYPDSWDDPEVSFTGNIVNFTAPIPNIDSATDTGVIFSVTPTVHPDGYTISLHLEPEIVAFAGWETYPFYYTSSTGTGGTTTIDNDGMIKMARISKRQLIVDVNVYDGETIILGGLVNAENMNRLDKWPVLGDIPLIGRVFSSEMAYNEKTTVIIFVTTRLVDNRGIPMRQRKGKFPDFNR